MQNLRALREARKLTQSQLAELAEINQATISKIENGIANPTSEMTEKLATALGVSPAELFGLPELQRRVLDAVNRMSPEQQKAAILVLEAMAKQ